MQNNNRNNNLVEIQDMLGKISTLSENLEEGIDFDPKTKTVSYNPSHEENVDTSIENNPTVDANIIPNINVWSIFKRKRGLQGDGNPLIYALRGEGWTFRSEQDRIAIEKQFDAIAEKFAKLYTVGVTIILPSSNILNQHIANVIMSKSKNPELISGIIRKLTTEEVEEMVLDFNSTFRKVYGDGFNEAYFQLKDYLEDMNQTREGMFTINSARKMRNL